MLLSSELNGSKMELSRFGFFFSCHPDSMISILFLPIQPWIGNPFSSEFNILFGKNEVRQVYSKSILKRKLILTSGGYQESLWSFWALKLGETLWCQFPLKDKKFIFHLTSDDLIFSVFFDFPVFIAPLAYLSSTVFVIEFVGECVHRSSRAWEAGSNGEKREELKN